MKLCPYQIPSQTKTRLMKALRTKCKLLALSADEPLTHTSDEDEDDEDQDGLSPADLRARFEDEVTVNDRLVTVCSSLEMSACYFYFAVKNFT